MASKKVVKRVRRTREEGMHLLLEAAKEMLVTTAPDELGIREIGDRAGVHHRFVAEWFGGKVGLFRAVHDSRTLAISDLLNSSSQFGDQEGKAIESIRHEIVLVNWLITHDSKFDSIEDAFPALTTAKTFLMRNFNLSEDAADKSAQIMGAIAVADALFQPHLNAKYPPIELIIHHVQSVAAISK